MEENIETRFNEILDTDDINALKTALQNLIVLFETQNHNYLELKQQVKNLRSRKVAMALEGGDSLTILPEDSRPPSNDIVDESYELLAAIRRTRKIHCKSTTNTEKLLNELSKNEEKRTQQMFSILPNK